MAVASLFKPEYLLRPGQFVRRLGLMVSRPQSSRHTVRLPWNWPIDVNPHEEIGKALLYLGVYDLSASEVLWRLCEEGETAMDIGANIGYMTALLARRVGSKGRVLSFEAHPDIAQHLQHNIDQWRVIVGDSVFQVHPLALSDRVGTVTFSPASEADNQGTGRVVEANENPPASGALLSIPCSTLDTVLSSGQRIGVAKMDVEGHEESVLRGGLASLKSGAIRDWLFEHHPDYPSPVTRLFEESGYKVFVIRKGFWGPRLADASESGPRSVWEPQNFLATRDAERAFRLLQSPGWQVLR